MDGRWGREGPAPGKEKGIEKRLYMEGEFNSLFCLKSSLK